jgi:hypothetical protein
MLAAWAALCLGFDSATERTLRKIILSADNTDPHVPPPTPPGIPTNVSTQLRLFKVLNVDIATGLLSLKIWRRMVWFDERLKWNAADYNNITEITAYPLNGREFELDNNLWLPPVYMTNTIVPEANTLETGGAWIYNTGKVWYSVPGTIDLSCRFTNLVNFPQETMSCPMEISSWTHSDRAVKLTYFDAVNGLVWTEVGTRRPSSGKELDDEVLKNVLRNHLDQMRGLPGETGKTVRLRKTAINETAISSKRDELRRGDYIDVDGVFLKLDDPLPCAEMGAQSRASGSSYNQFDIDKVDCLTNTRTYPVNPEETWTGLWIIFHITRKSMTYYILTILLPGCIITFLSFGPFWLDVSKSGERISFGATMLLTILLLMTIVAETVPKCGEMLWLDLFNWVNFGFCVLSMLESFLVYYWCFGENGEDSPMELKERMESLSNSLTEITAQMKKERTGLSRQISRLARKLEHTTVAEITTREIDYFSRRFFPAAYIFALSLVLGMHPKDNYEREYTLPSYIGMWPAGRIDLWPYPTLAVLFCLAAFFCHRRARDLTCRAFNNLTKMDRPQPAAELVAKPGHAGSEWKDTREPTDTGAVSQR